MAFFTRFFGRTVGEGAGVAIGTATSNVVEPALQELANAAWDHDPHMPLDASTAAALEAREAVEGYGGIALGDVHPDHEARYRGIRSERYRLLVALARRFPGVGELIELRRRNIARGAGHGITLEGFREALRHEGFTTETIDRVHRLTTEFLDPDQVANAVQQGFLPGDGLLPPPETGGQPFEPPVEEVPIDPTEEALTAGLDGDRLRVLAELSGNPPGPRELLEMWRRGIITETAVDRGIREGRTKTKWTPAFKALRWLLLSPATLVNLYLRGWIDQDEYHRRMRLHGFGPGEADDWYDSSGRPATALQMVKGFRRGGRIPGVDATEAAHVRKAVVQSDIRPEDYDVIYEGRETIPSAFVMRRLVQDGALSPSEAAEWLWKNAWNRGLADKAVESWAQGTGTTAKGLTAADLAAEYEALWLTRTQYIAGLRQLGYSEATAAQKANAEDAKRVRTARNQLIGRIRTQYVSHRVSRTRAVAALDEAGAPARVRDSLLPEWDLERSLVADALTPAQIKKAFRAGIFTRATAIDRLEAKGYDPDDAGIYLDE